MTENRDQQMQHQQVHHEQEQNRFVLPVQNDLAILEYEVDGTNVDFTHTWVPPELRGGGHAQLLVRRGLDWARENNLEISASCWYVKKFLD
jgi:predicted GNAT family acetyltransferase